MQLRATLVAGLLTAASVLLTGCGSASVSDVSAVASSFANDLRRNDGAAACRLLAPGTRAELEQSASQGCPTAILAEGLPVAGPVAHVSVFGTMAQARLTGDVYFVSRFDDGWKVMAAGCSRTSGPTYDCLLQGG